MKDITGTLWGRKDTRMSYENYRGDGTWADTDIWLGLIQAGNVLGYLILRMEYHAKMRYMLHPKY